MTIKLEQPISRIVHLKIYNEDEHAIDQNLIDPDALNTIFHLKKAGFEAYLVGGGVRDLLLKRRPKDFDISTSARPEEIRRLFGGRCLLIGKRFRLAHVRYGKKVIEVATFRAGDIDTSSLIVHDNRWGSEEDDVLRRDFTMNALFYDPTTRTILDHVGGYGDIKKNILRTIGEPALRFKQDPVRMIRLIKFKARFDFDIDPKAEHALYAHRQEIEKSAPARLLEEVFKMLESGHSKAFFELMHYFGFLEILFPCVYHFLLNDQGKSLLNYLNAIDTHIRKTDEKPDRPILLAAISFPILEEELKTLVKHRNASLHFNDIYHLSETLIKGIDASSFFHFPRKLLYTAHLISALQFRLAPLEGEPKFHGRFTRTEEFHSALEFLKLRRNINEEMHHFYTLWKTSHEHAQHRHSNIQ